MKNYTPTNTSMRYLTYTRPDIIYNVAIVSWYMEKPKSSHLKAARRMMNYWAVQRLRCVFLLSFKSFSIQKNVLGHISPNEGKITIFLKNAFSKIIFIYHVDFSQNNAPKYCKWEEHHGGGWWRRRFQKLRKNFKSEGRRRIQKPWELQIWVVRGRTSNLEPRPPSMVASVVSERTLDLQAVSGWAPNLEPWPCATRLVHRFGNEQLVMDKQKKMKRSSMADLTPHWRDKNRRICKVCLDSVDPFNGHCPVE